MFGARKSVPTYIIVSHLIGSIGSLDCNFRAIKNIIIAWSQVGGACDTKMENLRRVHSSVTVDIRVYVAWHGIY
jgi:hypothetical protein